MTGKTLTLTADGRSRSLNLLAKICWNIVKQKKFESEDILSEANDLIDRLGPTINAANEAVRDALKYLKGGKMAPTKGLFTWP